MSEPTPSEDQFRPRRSMLYMPAANERALEKAKTLACDVVILDLEDAVAPDLKEQARENACAAAPSGDYGDREMTIRVNAVGTQWHDADLEAACQAGPAGIVVPKVNSGRAVRELVAAMERYGAPDHTLLWAMVETPEAIGKVRKIAAAHERLTGLVLGTNDLIKELHAHHVPGRAPVMTALQLSVLAAREAGITVMDSVYNDVKDAEGFAAECAQGRDMGFDGKTLIHPGQIEACNAAYSPSPEAVEDAKGMLAAWEEGGATGVVTYNGKLVEHLHVDVARQVLAMHEAITARG